MTILQKIKNWYGAGHRANPFQWSNIRGFFQGMWRKQMGTDDHIREQIEWRKTQADPVCTKNGYCRVCGCSFPDKFYEDRSCDMSCYPEMMTSSQWETFKKYLKRKATKHETK